MVLYSERGDVAGCFTVLGKIQLHGIPRQPMLFEHECLETGRQGLVKVCTKYVFKEVTKSPSTSTSMISFWDKLGLYRVWSGPFELYPKRVEKRGCP